MTDHALHWRTRHAIVELSKEGKSKQEIARTLRVSRSSVQRVRQDYRAHGTYERAPCYFEARGRPSVVSDEQREVRRTYTRTATEVLSF